jgi:hypothetical protein
MPVRVADGGGEDTGRSRDVTQPGESLNARGRGWLYGMVVVDLIEERRCDSPRSVKVEHGGVGGGGSSGPGVSATTAAVG